MKRLPGNCYCGQSFEVSSSNWFLIPPIILTYVILRFQNLVNFARELVHVAAQCILNQEGSVY